MIERLLTAHGLELAVTVGQTLLVAIAYGLGSSRMLMRSDRPELSDELENLSRRIRHKWARKSISRDN